MLVISLQKFFIKNLSYHITSLNKKDDLVACLIPDIQGEDSPIIGSRLESNVEDLVLSSPVSVTQVPTEPILEISNLKTNLFMLNEEYKELVIYYDVDGFPDTELLIKMWKDVCIEESEDFYRYAFNQYYAICPYLHGFYDNNGHELEIDIYISQYFT